MIHRLLLQWALLPVLLLVGASAASAQTYSPTEPPSDYTLLVDSLLAPLNKNFVPSSILYDRVVSLAGLHVFTTATPSTASHWLQSYLELKRAAYWPGNEFPYTSPGLRHLAEEAATGARRVGGQLPIGLLDYDFAVLDTLAEERGAIRPVGGLYYDGQGYPYQTRGVCVVAPLADSVAQNVELTLPRQFLLGNNGRMVTSLVVQADNFTASLPPGGSQVVSFAGTGLRTLSFTVWFDDGSYALARALVYIRPTLALRTTAVTMPFSPNIISQPWRDYDGFTTYGEGEALAYLFHPSSKNDGKLRNPLIVMDGFDPADRRNIDRIYTDFAPLLPALQQAGRERDLIILNFPRTRRRLDGPQGLDVRVVDGGADYVERNALVLVELLSRAKSLMADPTQKVSIIGPSMGGLISRYALALMEKNYANSANSATFQNPYWKHNVDAWISFDAPHQGANIPLGDQYFIDYFKGISEVAADRMTRLNSIAAQQMLVSQHFDLAGRYYHVPFMRNLQANGLPGSFGYPTQLRRVALANGRDNGALNAEAGQPGVTGLQLDVARTAGNKRRQFFYRSTTPGTQIAANMYFSPAAGQRGTVFNGEARVIVAMAKDIVKRRERKLSSGPQGSYDLAPGGTFDTQKQIQDGVLNGRQLKDFEYRFSNLRPLHSFIPTVSALGFQYRTLGDYQGVGQLPNPYTNLAQRALLCGDETPFDAYYAYPNTNGSHVTLDGPAQQFLVRELFNVTQPPRFAPGSPATFCLNGSTTVSLQECSTRSGPITFFWTLSGPAVFTATGSTAVAGTTLTQGIRSTGAAGVITLSVIAQRSGAAPSPAASTALQVVSGGDPLALDIILAPGQVRICPLGSVNVQASGLSTGPYTWTTRIVRPGSVARSVTTTTPELGVVARYDPVEVTVTAPGQCGGTLPVASIWVVADSSPDGRACDPYAYQVSPVPGDAYLQISTLTTPAPSVQSLPDEENPHAYLAELYNDRGRRVKVGTTKTGLLRLETADLPAGLYHLKLRRGAQLITRNVSIHH